MPAPVRSVWGGAHSCPFRGSPVVPAIHRGRSRGTARLGCGARSPPGAQDHSPLHKEKRALGPLRRDQSLSPPAGRRPPARHRDPGSPQGSAARLPRDPDAPPAGLSSETSAQVLGPPPGRPTRGGAREPGLSAPRGAGDLGGGTGGPGSPGGLGDVGFWGPATGQQGLASEVAGPSPLSRDCGAGHPQ